MEVTFHIAALFLRDLVQKFTDTFSTGPVVSVQLIIQYYALDM